MKEKEKKNLAKTVDGTETAYLPITEMLPDSKPWSIRGISYSVRQGKWNNK